MTTQDQTPSPGGNEQTENNGLGRRLGHQPVLLATLARQILEAHLRQRHWLLDLPTSDLHTVAAEEADLLIRAMAAAAHADGGLDPREHGRIRAALRTSQIGEAERRDLKRIIEEPPCLETLLRRVNTPRMAARFYAVSLAVLDLAVSGREAAVNRSYLRYLAHRLDLPGDLVVRLNRRFGMRGLERGLRPPAPTR
ncbi:DUF533 domain-containing protein [Azospirillum soli]|uniref:DUF533 domain-containing protein n=1 Tax=Azospirillum soli TaxID=1304799 RepID=UPI001AE1BF94|nr:DUF533 domain-containing protein [Azospirillum soli]MBP2312849.1 uncharacterized membrane protein YebE (DUF533 family) [Azospirillum soli]